ncbi:GGDEF domain-containing protein [Symbiopectobacterium sp.]|uniref:GGDEF domain-containing protein n=1 Tax=Symbiopectobacterium sp. TaxID=2952789 RepID=UPI003F2FA8D5
MVLHGDDFRNALNIHQQPELSALATAILTNPGGSYQYDDDGPVFLNTRLIPEFDWYLMIEQRSHPSEHRLWITLMKNLGFSLAASLLFLFLLWLTIGGYQRRLERMATIDKLTGVMNRQAFDYFFKRLRAMRFTHRKPMSILLLDIDHFKRVNDAYGHGVGDLVLQNIAQLLLQAIRSSDQACRWGARSLWCYWMTVRWRMRCNGLIFCAAQWKSPKCHTRKKKSTSPSAWASPSIAKMRIWTPLSVIPHLIFLFSGLDSILKF